MSATEKQLQRHCNAMNATKRGNIQNIPRSYTPHVFNYRTGEILRPATPSELAQSDRIAETDGGTGVYTDPVSGEAVFCV